MSRFAVDDSPLRRRIESARRRGPAVQKALLRGPLGDLVDAMLAVSPRDTHRYVRGWQDAANKAGLGPYVLSPIRASTSEFAQSLRDSLLSDARYYQDLAKTWEERARWNERGTASLEGSRRHADRRRVRDTTRIRRIAERAKALAERSRQEAERLRADSIVIRGRSSTSTRRPRLSTGEELPILNLTQLARVVEPKGGSARIYERAGVVVFELKNREPHASIVEAKHGVARRAFARVRGRGLERIGRGLVRALERAA